MRRELVAQDDLIATPRMPFRDRLTSPLLETWAVIDKIDAQPVGVASE
jgi:hypothetical protein